MYFKSKASNALFIAFCFSLVYFFPNWVYARGLNDSTSSIEVKINKLCSDRILEKLRNSGPHDLDLTHKLPRTIEEKLQIGNLLWAAGRLASFDPKLGDAPEIQAQTIFDKFYVKYFSNTNLQETPSRAQVLTYLADLENTSVEKKQCDTIGKVRTENGRVFYSLKNIANHYRKLGN